MARVVKDPHVRREEIMRSAEILFQKQGYEKTPVEAIIKKAGIAKGTFYHYFKTKQDILKALVDSLGKNMEAHLNQIAETPEFNAIEKLKLIIRGKEKNAIVASSVMKIIHKPENREFQERLNIYSVKNIYPIITKIFQQGFNEGIFKKNISNEVVQMIFAGSQFVLNSGLFKWSKKQELDFLKSGQDVLEVLVGVKPGVLNFISKK